MTTAMIVFALLLLAIVGPRVAKIYIFDVVDRMATDHYDPTMTPGQDVVWRGTLQAIDEWPETTDCPEMELLG